MLQECLQKLPNGFEAFVKCQVSEQGEQPIYKYVRLEEVTNTEGLYNIRKVPLDLSELFVVDRRFYTETLDLDKGAYAEEPAAKTINEVITEELRALFNFDKPVFLERAKEMLVYYCTEEGKLKKQINFSYVRSEAVIIIKRGAKTIKFLEDSQSVHLLQLINELEVPDSQVNYYAMNLDENVNAELVNAESWFVMPKYLNVEETGLLDNLIIECKSVFSKFDTEEYKYGLEHLNYRYTQREVFTEIDEILKDSPAIAVLRVETTTEGENPTTTASYISDPMKRFPAIESTEGCKIEVFTMEVSEVDGKNIAKVSRRYFNTESNSVEVVKAINVENWILARLFAKTNYPIEKYDLKYRNSESQPEVINLADLVISDAKEVFSMEVLNVEDEGFELEKVENEQQLPLIPEETTNPNDMFDSLKDKAEDMSESEFETYATEYVAEMYQRARVAGVYIYFIQTIPSESGSDYLVIPMSQAIELTKQNINNVEIFSVNPNVPNEAILTVQNLLDQSKLVYTKGTEGQEDHATYEFYIGELVTLFAKRLTNNKIDSYGIKGKKYSENKLNNPTLAYPEYEDRLSDFLIKQIKTDNVYAEFELSESEGSIDFFNAWKSTEGNEHAAVSELNSMIALYLSEGINAAALKLYFYEWQLKAAYLNYDPETHEVTKSNEVATSPVTFRLATSELHTFRRDDYDIDSGDFETTGTTEGLTMDILIGLDDETLRSELGANTYVNPYPFRFAADADINGGGEGEDVPDDGEEGNTDDKYVLRDEDQNETRGWIYTGLIKRLIAKYLNGSLRGNETSWDNITDREMMSNDEMSNIITLLNTRYNNEIEKAESIPELYNILAPESGFGIIDAINMILTKEQTYDRKDVRYSEEEIRAINESIERWYAYYEPNTATFLDTAEIMIWEGMDLEYYTIEAEDNGELTTACNSKFSGRVDEIVSDYNKIFNKYSPSSKKEWEKCLLSGTEATYFRIASFNNLKDSEWFQFIGEVQGIRNSWQTAKGTGDNRILLCIGTNYGEMWSVFGRQPGDDMPLETYFYLKNDESTNGATRKQTREITNNVIYIPRDRYNSNLVWNTDKYFHSNLYQLLFYPYYLMINDTSKFKDYINPVSITEENIDISYLGYIILVPKKNN